MRAATRLDDKLETAKLENQKLLEEIAELEQKEAALNDKLHYKEDWFAAKLQEKEDTFAEKVKTAGKKISLTTPVANELVAHTGALAAEETEAARTLVNQHHAEIKAAREELSSAKKLQRQHFVEKLERRRSTKVSVKGSDSEPAVDIEALPAPEKRGTMVETVPTLPRSLPKNSESDA